MCLYFNISFPCPSLYILDITWNNKEVFPSKEHNPIGHQCKIINQITCANDLDHTYTGETKRSPNQRLKTWKCNHGLQPPPSPPTHTHPHPPPHPPTTPHPHTITPTPTPTHPRPHPPHTPPHTHIQTHKPHHFCLLRNLQKIFMNNEASRSSIMILHEKTQTEICDRI